MLKLQRPSNTNRPSKPRTERVDFKFSNFQALQVPKGWDRLLVSLIHVETGKTMARLGKALVRNGSCQWTDTLSESIHITRDDSSKGYEECLVKLIVLTGSTRSSILGEAIINLSNYASSRVPAAVSQPLKKCIYGTVLQLKIQCQTPRTKTGYEESKNTYSQEKDRNVQYYDVDNKSCRSDNSSDSTTRADADLPTTSSPLKLGSKETSQSARGTIQSVDSREGFMEKQNLSTKNAILTEDCDNSVGNQFGNSYSTCPILDYHPFDDNISSPNHSLVNAGRYLQEDYKNEETVNRRSVGSSKHLVEAAEDTIDESRAKAKMWEGNARKLMVDLDVSRKELSEQSKKQSELVMELSAAHAEQDGLRREVEKLKLELEKQTTCQRTGEPVTQSENLVQIQKVLEDEMKYQQDLNDNIGQQLKRSQESNIELVSVLQELEETIEQQRTEIENLSSLKKFESDVKLLEEALRDRTDELENERKSNGQILSRVEKDYEYKISAKEDEIASLEATLSGYVNGGHFEASNGSKDNNADLVKEIGLLRQNVEELEKDCAELTDENLELLLKLKDLNKITDIRNCESFDSMSSENRTVCHSDESEVSDPKLKISANTDLERNELENSLSGLREENVHLQECISDLATQIRRLKDEKEFCVQEREDFKSVAMSLQDEIQQLKEETCIQTSVLKEESEDLKKQLLGAQEECEYLKGEKMALQASAESFELEIPELRESNSEASREISRLLAGKGDMQASLQEVKSKAEITENKLNAALQESESKFKDLSGQLASSRQSHEKLMADHERTLQSLANCKRSEEKLKTDLNDLELKHTISDYEHQQLLKETGILKGRLQNMSSLQDEISILRSELEGCKLDKGKLELALQTVSSYYERLKAENISFLAEISILQGVALDVDECKRNKLVLEEKLLKMEAAKEAICIQNEDLRNELSETKRENMQFQKRIYRLEEENTECLRKAHSLEEEVKSLKERDNIRKEDAHKRDLHDQSHLAISMDHDKDGRLLGNEVAEGLDASNKNRVLHESRNPSCQKRYSVSSKKPSINGEVAAGERYERTKSSLETELRDLKERYLEMSLKYAEVESEREDLVMKLKATKGGKRWLF